MSNYYVTNKKTRDIIVRRFSMFDGVGLDLTNASNYDEALEESGLNYGGAKEKLFLADGTEVKDSYAVVKSNDHNAILGVVGSKYQPIDNREAFAVAEDIVNGGFAQYEVGGPSIGAKEVTNYGRTFLALRGEDFDVQGDTFNSFVVFNNSFDGSSGVKYRVVCQRVVCMNGMVRFLGGKDSNLFISLPHTESLNSRVKQVKEIVMQRAQDVKQIQREAQIFSETKLTRGEFEGDILPFILERKKFVEKDKERERGHERVVETVNQIMQCYEADDVQNYANTAYRAILALSDFETHSAPLRDTGNGQIYMNRILKGMRLTTAVAQYIAATRGIRQR